MVFTVYYVLPCYPLPCVATLCLARVMSDQGSRVSRPVEMMRRMATRSSKSTERMLEQEGKQFSTCVALVGKAFVHCR